MWCAYRPPVPPLPPARCCSCCAAWHATCRRAWCARRLVCRSRPGMARRPQVRQSAQSRGCGGWQSPAVHLHRGFRGRAALRIGAAVQGESTLRCDTGHGLIQGGHRGSTGIGTSSSEPSVRATNCSILFNALWELFCQALFRYRATACNPASLRPLPFTLRASTRQSAGDAPVVPLLFRCRMARSALAPACPASPTPAPVAHPAPAYGTGGRRPIWFVSGHPWRRRPLWIVSAASGSPPPAPGGDCHLVCVVCCPAHVHAPGVPLSGSVSAPSPWLRSLAPRARQAVAVPAGRFRSARSPVSGGRGTPAGRAPPPLSSRPPVGTARL